MQTPKERQALYQARQREKGRARLHAWIGASTARALNALAAQHGLTQAQIVELGVHLVQQRVGGA